MKSSLPIFVFLVFAVICREIRAQSAPPAVAEAGGQPASAVPAAADSIAGDVMLRRVMGAVDTQRSISAKLRYKIDLLGRTMLGSGNYLQQGRGPERMLRLDLQLQSGMLATNVLEICDGTALWIFEDFGEAKTLGRVDLVRLRRARPKSPSPPSVAAINTWFALGGLPKLLASLDTSFRFGPVADSRLDDVHVWTLEGQWEPGRLVQLLPDQKAAIESGGAVDLSKLAPNLPDRVTMHVGCDDLFPYRFEYWRAEKGTDRSKLLVVMEFYEVQVGVPLDRRHFIYAPGAVQPTDRTQSYLDRLLLEEVAPGEASRPRLQRR
jgi:hypothetical protein